MVNPLSPEPIKTLLSLLQGEGEKQNENKYTELAPFSSILPFARAHLLPQAIQIPSNLTRSRVPRLAAALITPEWRD